MSNQLGLMSAVSIAFLVVTPANLHVRKSCKQCKGHTAVLTRQNDVYIYNYACVCLCLSELLLGVSPRSGLFVVLARASCC